MEPRRWVNPSQPQTLYTATFLLYLNAVFGVLFFGSNEVVAQFGAVIGFLFLLAQVVGGYGIANERRWGYLLAVGSSALGLLPFVFLALDNGITELFDPFVLLALIFPVALFALLIHPMSRDYQKVWFS